MIYRFSDCTLDTSQHKLYRAGELVETEPKVFEVLVYLVEQRGELVSRDALFERCWPGVYVNEGTLSRCISRVRKAIGHGGQRKLIETVHRKGYRFVGEVSEQPNDGSAVAQIEPISLDAAESDSESETEPASLDARLTAKASESAESPAVASAVASGTAPAPSAPPAPEKPEPAVLPAQPAVREASPAALAVSAERRQITVLSCHRVADDSDHDLDLEELYHRKQAFGQLCLECFSPFGGYLAQSLQDGFMVYFGYPQAQEDSARRAVLAGLQLTERAQTIRAESTPALPCELQVGIHTGPIIVESADSESAQVPLTSGPTQTIAARLCEQANPQSVLVSETTAQLVGGEFDWQRLGKQQIPGRSRPLVCYRVTHEHRQILEKAAQPREGAMPFVGRAAELALLNERWTQVREGMGQVVLISGEAGIGKSRLVERLKQQIADETPNRLTCRSSPYHQHTAFFPLTELLRRTLREQAVAPAASELERIEAAAECYRLSSGEAVSLLAALLSVPLPPERYPALTMSPQQQRQQSLHLLLNLLLAQAQTQPLLFVIEDLHWADPSTLEFIELLVRQVPVTAMLVVLTCRPEFDPSWDRQAAVTPLKLDRLNHGQIEQLLWRMTEGKRLPALVIRQISEKTDGVPLFIEELTRMLLESGQLVEAENRFELTGPIDELSIPPTLQQSLMARLDRLPAGKRTAQWGAVLGREFSFDLLAAVSPLDEPMLQQGLGELLAAGLLYQRGLPPNARYLFKHALVCDTAYHSMLKRQRQTLHREVARVLEARFAQTVTEQPELLAQHYCQAGLAEAAIPYWYRAGRNASERWAHEEAIEHLTTGLRLLEGLPDTPERTRQELDMRISLGPSLIAIRGPADPSIQQCFERARELCDRLGESSHLFPVLANLWRCHHSLARHDSARQLGEELLAEGRRQNDPQRLQAAYQMIGTSLTQQGELSSGCDYLQKSLDLANRFDHAGVDARHSQDPRALCLSYLLGALQYSGYPERARKQSLQLAQLAEALEHPHSRALALHYLGIFHLNRHDLQELRQRTDALVALAAEHQFPKYLAVSDLMQGWLMAAQGRAEQGVVQMRLGLDAYEALGGQAGLVPWRFHLAEAYGIADRPDEGLQTLAEALTLMERTTERFLEPSLYLQQGVLLLQQTDPDVAQAEACLLKALDVARRQQARWWELRTAVSLAQLWRDQAKQKQAHQLLAPIYEWFTEGFDTAYLQEAKVLLEQLRAEA